MLSDWMMVDVCCRCKLCIYVGWFCCWALGMSGHARLFLQSVLRWGNLTGRDTSINLISLNCTVSLHWEASIFTSLFVGHSHITLQPKTGCPQKLSRVEPGQYLDGRPPGKTRLLLVEVLVRPAGGAHPMVCVGPNTPV